MKTFAQECREASERERVMMAVDMGYRDPEIIARVALLGRFRCAMVIRDLVRAGKLEFYSVEEPTSQNAERALGPVSPADPAATCDRGMDRDPIGQPLPAELPDGRC